MAVPVIPTGEIIFWRFTERLSIASFPVAGYLKLLCKWTEMPEMRHEEKYSEKGRDLKWSYALSLLR